MLDKPDKVRVDLAGPAQTMLDMLYAKALDAEADDPILGDEYARELVRQIDYNWDRTKITARNKKAFFAALRTAHFDEWARQFIAAHPESVVLHLGCGLDARRLRLQPGPGVDWYDVDCPEVIALRERFYPSDGCYRLVAASVTDPGWLAAIPNDRPVLLLAEGLTMYLEEAAGVALLRRVVQRFPSGELQFDALTRLGIWSSQKLLPVVRQSGSTLRWSVEGPSDILRAVPGTRLVSSIPYLDPDLLARAPRRYRLTARLLTPFPLVKKASQFYRYAL
jgi:methyltransferase (TIGR00027 family)